MIGAGMRISSAVTVCVLISSVAAAFADEPPAPNWVKVTDNAGWQARDSSGEVVFRDQLWILGGWFDSFSAPPRDVWSSSDGRSWKLVTKKAPWKHSDLPMTLVFKDRMWFMGGWYNGRLAGHGASSEVWSSADGVNWEQVTRKAPWHPRIWFSSVVYRDRLWVLGGWSNNPSKNWGDVWYSRDGKTWTRLLSKVSWKERHEHSTFVFKDKIWVAG